MKDQLEQMTPRGWLQLAPRLGSDELDRRFVEFCSALSQTTKTSDGMLSSQALRRFRRGLAIIKSRPYSMEEIKLHLACSVVLDLVAHTWKLKVTEDGVIVHSPMQLDNSPVLEKERVRKAHLIERDATLIKRTLTEFVRGMERQRLTSKGWHSIFSLMRDGQELAKQLTVLDHACNGGDQVSLASDVISPYIQFVEGDGICEQTGLKLRDIWRYFRLTWVNEYKSVPGRSVMILIRDSAASNHPIIGIAALGSSVVQQRVRDELIGWDASGFSNRFVERPSVKIAKSLHSALQHLIDGIYINDLIRDRFLTRAQIKRPTVELIETLRAEGKAARARHELNPHVAVHKSNTDDLNDPKVCKKKAETNLFRSKRCFQLAKLLVIRKAFQEHGFDCSNRRQMLDAIKAPQVRAAIGQLIRLVKAEHVGIDMMDVTVCGAVAPYNIVLGGKLVCMLLGSPEIVAYYADRYEKKPSIIASCMKATAVRRPHHLVLLCTTSLYGIGSSQYNRIKIPAEALGGSVGETFEYKKWGYSAGFGSFHFSQETMNWIKFLLGRQGNRRVNSIFGEGVNPLMRKIREALDLVGLLSDELLLHGNERVVYGIPLAINYKELLLGLTKRPKYIVPQSDKEERTRMLFAYWCKRWLFSRIKNSEMLQKVAQHTLTHPIRHGARVLLPGDDEESGYLWDVLEVEQAHPY
jgi:hypothetical protein